MAVTTPDPRRWRALALLCGAFFMVILDAAIVVVALPSIEVDLGFSPQDLQWVLSAYALTFGGLLLLGGRAADLLGRRRVFMAGLALFTLASLLCGLAWSPASLIAARALQGVGAAIMTPTALSILTTTFPEGAERNKALGIWGSLGGDRRHGGLADRRPADRHQLGVDLPDQRARRGGRARARAAPAAGQPRRGREARLRPGRRAVGDRGAGAARLRPGRGARERLGRPAARSRCWPRAAALLAVFAVIESRVAAPLLPLRVLRSRTLVTANVVMLLFSTVGYGMPFILTLYAQQVLGYSPVEFGLTSIVFPADGHGRRDRRAGAWSASSASAPSPRPGWRCSRSGPCT